MIIINFSRSCSYSPSARCVPAPNDVFIENYVQMKMALLVSHFFFYLLVLLLCLFLLLLFYIRADSVTGSWLLCSARKQRNELRTLP
jgi:hypothetical protein